MSVWLYPHSYCCFTDSNLYYKYFVHKCYHYVGMQQWSIIVYEYLIIFVLVIWKCYLWHDKSNDFWIELHMSVMLTFHIIKVFFMSLNLCVSWSNKLQNWWCYWEYKSSHLPFIFIPRQICQTREYHSIVLSICFTNGNLNLIVRNSFHSSLSPFRFGWILRYLNGSLSQKMKFHNEIVINDYN